MSSKGIFPYAGSSFVIKNTYSEGDKATVEFMTGNMAETVTVSMGVIAG